MYAIWKWTAEVPVIGGWIFGHSGCVGTLFFFDEQVVAKLGGYLSNASFRVVILYKIRLFY